LNLLVPQGVQLSAAGQAQLACTASTITASSSSGDELHTVIALSLLLLPLNGMLMQLQTELTAQRAQVAHWQGVAQGLQQQAMDLCTASLKK
jgi:hypothetical protein